MASDASESSMEFEDFEVPEVDGTLLWDLLEELENEEGNKNEKLGLVVQSPLALDEANNMMTGGQVSLEQHETEICIPDSTWVGLDVVETDPSYEVAAWFTDDMVEMVDFGVSVGDYPLFPYNGEIIGASSCNELTYNCLWGDS